jgi:hypothetical protein
MLTASGNKDERLKFHRRENANEENFNSLI